MARALLRLQRFVLLPAQLPPGATGGDAGCGGWQQMQPQPHLPVTQLRLDRSGLDGRRCVSCHCGQRIYRVNRRPCAERASGDSRLHRGLPGWGSRPVRRLLFQANRVDCADIRRAEVRRVLRAAPSKAATPPHSPCVSGGETGRTNGTTHLCGEWSSEELLAAATPASASSARQSLLGPRSAPQNASLAPLRFAI